jgi:ribonuclease-3
MLFGIEIDNKELLEQALQHPSAGGEHYERLEFLGDAVLKLIISDILYKKYPDYREGDLTKIRSIVVSDSILGEIAACLGLDIKLEEKLRGTPSIYACAFEAVLGAYYLDGKFNELKKFLEELFTPYFEDVDVNFHKYNAKAVLQEYTQAQSKELPVYKVIDETGPAHDKVFTVEVSYNGVILARGGGRTKKEAEQNAAASACEVLEC